MASPKFSIDLDKLESDVFAELSQSYKKNTEVIFTEIIAKSPILTGQFIDSWHVSIGVRNTSEARGGLQPKDLSSMEQLDGTKKIYLSNNLHYAHGLEWGTSWRKAPDGMIRVTIAENLPFVKLISQKG